jgi:hypothetical protein
MVEARQRFVEQQQPRIKGQGARHFEPLEKAQRQSRRRRVGCLGDSDQLQQLARPRPLRRPRGRDQGAQRIAGPGMAGGKGDIVEDTHLAERPHQLLRQAEAAAHPGVSRQAGDILAVQGHRSLGRADDAGDRPQHRRFAGPVGTDQAEQLALVEGERHVVDRGHATEAHGYAGDFEQPAHAAALPRSRSRSQRTPPARPPGLNSIIENSSPP